ncbi:MAG: hypothetical protein ABI216_09230 [Devosia sp.]
MDHAAMNRAIFGFAFGLCLVGGLALGGLVSPLAKGYLSPQQTAGGTEILKTNSPFVRVRFVPGDVRLHLVRNGRPVELWIEHDGDAPDCLPEPGQA